MLSEKEKALAGLPYSGFSEELINDRVGKDVEIEPPFYCDYGYNIHIGDNFFCNFNCTILDCNKVEIGDRVLFGPNVSLYPVSHPIQPEERVNGPELAFPIKVLTIIKLL
ncbi:sugar O-acetyltransferase [Rhizophagus irregularis DAOM 181602=DAOM 197198]|nr:sugar O-acetyltransferase [Rhizophagus irregularis DAOM 181602=DAOM 197198]